jgi:hypothetical protein
MHNTDEGALMSHSNGTAVCPASFRPTLFRHTLFDKLQALIINPYYAIVHIRNQHPGKCTACCSMRLPGML